MTAADANAVLANSVAAEIAPVLKFNMEPCSPEELMVLLRK